jgi:hypothetical protein
MSWIIWVGGTPIPVDILASVARILPKKEDKP